MAKTNRIGQIILAAMGILLMAGYALGFTVNPVFWNTENVLTSGRAMFIAIGAAAIAAAAGYLVLSKVFPNDILLHLVTLAVGVLAMFAILSLWGCCVVEVAYIYGEGNLELGNASAVRGSVFLFAATGCYILAALSTIATNALGLPKLMGDK